MNRVILDRLIATRAPAADARLAYGSGSWHFGDLRLPPGPGPHPVVVVVHGGSWRAQYDLEFMGHAAAALTRRGVATWNVEFRRVGNPGGGWPGTFLDVGAALDHLRKIGPKYNLDLDRIVVTGHSSGGHLALWLAARSRIPVGDVLYVPDPLRIKAVVPVAGVGDLRFRWELESDAADVLALMGASPLEEPGRYATASPANLLPFGVPQVIVHGTADDVTPFVLGESFHAAAIAAGDDAILVPIPGADHFEVIDPESPAWDQVSEATRSRLDLTSD
jgi:acetyl esterase/lipase